MTRASRSRTNRITDRTCAGEIRPSLPPSPSKRVPRSDCLSDLPKGHPLPSPGVYESDPDLSLTYKSLLSSPMTKFHQAKHSIDVKRASNSTKKLSAEKSKSLLLRVNEDLYDAESGIAAQEEPRLSVDHLHCGATHDSPPVDPKASSAILMPERAKVATTTLAFAGTIKFDFAEQRTYFLILDLVSTEVIEFIVRVSAVVTSMWVRHSWNADNFSTVKVVPTGKWATYTQRTVTIGMINLAIMILLLNIGLPRHLSGRKIIQQIYGGSNTFFLLLSHATTLMFCWSVLEDHHGFDITGGGRFDWVGCNGVVNYPDCIEVDTKMLNETSFDS